ncbi:MAG TPA: hypothetical protein PLU30_16170 [Verrucomicrobiae bacterium]|nr:hypothetical protein [Verrucomicrobiae bacterium]
MTDAPPSTSEAHDIVQAIAPIFSRFADQYDTKKYPTDAYDRIREQFARPSEVTGDTLREALLWKYGHLGKNRIPASQEKLIAQIQGAWTKFSDALPPTPRETFVALDHDFGGKTRFITVAFLLHLLFPSTIPIIDQHNFRAVNALMAGVRPGWRKKQKPSRYEDILLLAGFMEAILDAWQRADDGSAPTSRDLDKFLMMYGKHLKGQADD